MKDSHHDALHIWPSPFSFRALRPQTSARSYTFQPDLQEYPLLPGMIFRVQPHSPSQI